MHLLKKQQVQIKVSIKCMDNNWFTKINMSQSLSRTISQRENLIINPYDIANIFNNYFSYVADTANENINYSHKHF